jgi:hypothetical protein
MSDGTQTSGHPVEYFPRHGGKLIPFRKGQSGNPGGNFRNEYNLARKICAEYTEEAIRRQLELMRSDDERVAFIATEAILNRGIGKPRDHSGEQLRQIDVSVFSDDERTTLATLLRKGLGV